MAESKWNAADYSESGDDESNISGHFRRSKTSQCEVRNKLIVIDEQAKEKEERSADGGGDHLPGSKFIVSQNNSQDQMSSMDVEDQLEKAVVQDMLASSYNMMLHSNSSARKSKLLSRLSGFFGANS